MKNINNTKTKKVHFVDTSVINNNNNNITNDNITSYIINDSLTTNRFDRSSPV
jgi:hypothetical protein